MTGMKIFSTKEKIKESELILREAPPDLVDSVAHKGDDVLEGNLTEAAGVAEHSAVSANAKVTMNSVVTSDSVSASDSLSNSDSEEVKDHDLAEIESNGNLESDLETECDESNDIEDLDPNAPKRLWKTLLLEVFEYHKVPLTVLASLCIVPKAIFLWVFLVILWTAAEILFPKLPRRVRNFVLPRIPRGLKENRWFREIREGIAQVRPFIQAAAYFCCAPIALTWMFSHWLGRLLPGKHKNDRTKAMSREDDHIVFVQGKDLSKHDEDSNFFHSPAFAMTSLGIFGCGLPAALTYLLYKSWGIDAIVGYPSHDPRFHSVIVIICFYLMSMAWSIMPLFFRAWFTFPLNFVGNEEEFHLDAQKIARKSPNWFTRVLQCNCAIPTPDSMNWEDVHSLTFESTMRLYPLPTKLLHGDSISYKIMNRLAAFYDSIIDSIGRTERIAFSTAPKGAFVSEQMTLRLGELTGEERAKLFYASKKWAPHIRIDERTQEQLLGSSVLREPQYTQVWFDLLTSKSERRRQNALQPGDVLNDGEFTIVERIASGGQATVYLANQTRPDGNTSKQCVLKEFILSSSDAVGALLESAREFESEASLLSLLDHQHIVKNLDFFSEDRRAYLVLEHVEGQSLRNLVRENGPLPESQVADLAMQMCEVLSYLHSQTPAIVHRDFSPDNIILHPERGIILIDFSLSGSGTSTGKRTVVGKHAYAPPEQFREQACPQSDIYAMGATLHFLLTGRDPKPISCTNPSKVNETVSESMSQIVEKCTALDLESRYAELSWLKLDLLDYIDERIPV